MKGLEQVRRAVMERLEQAGVRALSKMDEAPETRPDAPVAAVAVREGKSGGAGFGSYLGQETDPETGVKYIDADKCINCWMCVMACPYGMIAPAAEMHSADKCDRCFKMKQPYCMAACPTGAIELLTPEEIEEKLRQLRAETINELKVR